MKNRLLTWSILLIGVFGLLSCDELDTVSINETLEPNTLEAFEDDEIVLQFENASDTAFTLNWSMPDYGFQAGAMYTLQMAPSGSSFANPFTLLQTRAFSGSVTVEDLNAALLGLSIAPDVARDIDFRVIADVGSGIPAVYSNTQTASITPYATTFPSIWGMGEGLKGWGPWPGNAVEWHSLQYKKYETIAYFTNGKDFRWFEQLDWNPTSYNYPFFTTVSPVFGPANDGDSNFRVVGASGWYKVTIDLVAKTVVATAVDEPVLYVTGDDFGWGWNAGQYEEFEYDNGSNTFTITTDLTNNNLFRFFPQTNWSPSYTFDYFESVDTDLQNQGAGTDQNFRYIGTTGTRTITVNLTTKVVSLD